MKKIVPLLTLFFALVLSAAFFLTPCGQKFALFLQKFFPSECNKSIVLVNIDDDYLQELGSPFINSEKSVSFFNDVLLLSRELGAKSFLCDLNLKNPLVKIDSLVQKNDISKEKQFSLFNVKIVIPWRERFGKDLKIPEIATPLFPVDFQLSSFKDSGFLAGNTDVIQGEKKLLVKKDGIYYADPILASVSDFLDVKQIRLTDSALFLDCDEKNVRIPRSKNGFLLLRYPSEPCPDSRQLAFSELFRLSKKEKKFFDYIMLMNEQGFFGEFEGENPVEIYSAALTSKSDFETYCSLKKKFYSSMAHYLSGRQEKRILEAVSDENRIKLTRNMFETCKKLFSELETMRTKISEKTADSLCVFAFTAESSADFTRSPFDPHFSKSLESYAAANMILNEDFFEMMPLIFGAVILLLTLIFFVLLILIFHLGRKSKAYRKTANSFLQCVPDSVIKKVISNPDSVSSENGKFEVSVLSVSIRESSALRKLLNESQLTAFFNYYFDKVFSSVIEKGGLIESYRDDSVLSLFGAPIADEKNCESSVEAALAVKENDRQINEDILILPQSPKPDGMDDDLYTAFFILNHNGVKILTDTGIWSGEAFCACMGSKDKKSYRITGEAWKNAVEIRDYAKKFGSEKVLISGSVFEAIKNGYIVRNIPVNSGNSIYEVLDSISSDDEKLWNYANYWNQAAVLLQKGEKEKALAVFIKLSEGRPNDKTARYFINSLNAVE